MPTTIYDSSQLTKRRDEKAKANSFLTRQQAQTTGYAPHLGIYDNSILNDVRSGNMTEYKKCDGGFRVSPGCPCPGINSEATVQIPGGVTNIVYSIGSIIVSWNPPTEGTGPFTYIVIPYLDNTALPAVTTSNTSYRFTNLDELKQYTFSVCAVNNAGMGPTMIKQEPILMPPKCLSNIIEGISETNITPALQYIINNGLNNLLEYVATANLGPTRGSRIAYLWSMGVATAWDWVNDDSPMSGTKDDWNWNAKASPTLSPSDSMIWICQIVEYITELLTGKEYSTHFNFSSQEKERVKANGKWDNWKQQWDSWYSARQSDGSKEATAQPGPSDFFPNRNNTLVVDSSQNTFADPTSWTPLTILGKKQNYLTYNWESVRSTCLSGAEEQQIINSVEPSTGNDRASEIQDVVDIAATLTDDQKLLAEFWEGGAGTVAPPGMFVWMWKEYMRILPNISEKTIIYSLLDLTIHLFEGSRVTWALKKKYMEARPIQEIRVRYSGQTLTTWEGEVRGDMWKPYQKSTFVTPPFADFPSGHSHFSNVFALTMQKWFGDEIEPVETKYDKQKLICPLFSENQNTTYGVFSFAPGSSIIQSGVPHAPSSISFETWSEMADGTNSSGYSRFYGGIHASTAHTASRTSAQEVHQLIESKWNISKE
jgi:hypothetical protein